MTVGARLRRLEDRAGGAGPVEIAAFTRDGTPLNDAARRMKPEDRARSRRITLTIDGPDLADREANGDGRR